MYESLNRCGLLESLIQSGKEYVFISNVDNLGATVDLRILYHVMSGGDGDGKEVRLILRLGARVGASSGRARWQWQRSGGAW